MDLTLHIWRQPGPDKPGRMDRYEVKDVNEHSSFLEMLDVLNEQLIERGEEPIAFDHDCREGICGSCGFMINGEAHGPLPKTTVCQLHMRHFKNGDALHLEPWRARAFPVVKDLMVNRSSFDRIIQAGGYISVSTGQRPRGEPDPGAEAARRPRLRRRRVHRLRRLRGAVPERRRAALHRRQGLPPRPAAAGPAGAVRPGASRWWSRWRRKASAACSNFAECEAVCPKGISIDFIARMNRDYIKSKARGVNKVPLERGVASGEPAALPAQRAGRAEPGDEAAGRFPGSREAHASAA